MKRRYIAYAPNAFSTASAKTAHGVMRYSQDEVVAVFDPDHAGKRACDVVAFLSDHTTPIVGSMQDALSYGPTAFLLGTAPKGGALPTAWRHDILTAISAGLEIVSGLHDFLSDDAEFAHAARQRGVRLWDVRAVPSVSLFSGAAYSVEQPILLTVGNDCAVGKMSAALELTAAGCLAGIKTRFIPTGQTGIMIAGWGIAIDRVISDFAAGAAEQLILQAANDDTDLLIVEGQGCINHPAYAAVTTALLYGCAPDALLLVCEVLGTHIEPYPIARLNLLELIAAYEHACTTVKLAHVIGIALNTHGLTDTEAQEAISDARAISHLPCDDIVRFGAAKLFEEIAPHLREKRILEKADS